MTLDPTLRDQLAKTIHDATCPCVYFPDSHLTSCADYLNAADKAAELLTAPRFPDGWERGHEAKYWAQTGLTPYGLTLDPERAPGVLNWLGVNYYTPDSPHLPASAAAPVVLPTVGEVREAIIAGTKLGGWMPHTAAQAILDLIAARLPVWQPVEPGTVIKAGTRVRRPYLTDSGAVEHILPTDIPANDGWCIDPRTVPAEPVDPRVAVVGEWLDSIGSEEHTADDARDLLARLDAVRADA